MEAEGLEFHAGNNALFLVGNYEKENFNFTREKIIHKLIMIQKQEKRKPLLLKIEGQGS